MDDEHMQVMALSSFPIEDKGSRLLNLGEFVLKSARLFRSQETTFDEPTDDWLQFMMFQQLDGAMHLFLIDEFMENMIEEALVQAIVPKIIEEGPVHLFCYAFNIWVLDPEHREPDIAVSKNPHSKEVLSITAADTLGGRMRIGAWIKRNTDEPPTLGRWFSDDDDESADPAWRAMLSEQAPMVEPMFKAMRALGRDFKERL